MRNFFFALLSGIILSGCKKESVLINDTGTVFYYSNAEVAPGVEIGEIYHTQYFAAFTDVAYYRGSWFAAFRMGTSHEGGEDGQIKVLTSTDGNVWNVKKIFTIENYDLREARFVIDSFNNNLYLNFWGRHQSRYGQIDRRNYLVEFNKSLNDWGPIQDIQYDHTNGEQFIFWRLTYSKGNMYCIAYHAPIRDDDNICLFVNDKTFINYKKIEKLILGDSPTETTLRFNEKDSMYLLVRTKTNISPMGISLPTDYKHTDWIKNPLSTVLASPNFLFYKNKLLITGRDSKGGRFRLFSYDLTHNTVEKTYTFPSGYETGYGGMSFNPYNENELWITYYSITDNASAINLAKIDLLKFL